MFSKIKIMNTEMQQCRACLNSSRKLHNLYSTSLMQLYETIVGNKWATINNVSVLMCTMCVALLRKFLRFQLQCIAAEQAVTNYQLSENAVNTQDKTVIPQAVTLTLLLPPKILDSTVAEPVKTENKSDNFDNNIDNFDNNSGNFDIYDNICNKFDCDDDDDNKPLAFSKREKEKTQIETELEKSLTLFVEDVEVKFESMDREIKKRKSGRKKQAKRLKKEKEDPKERKQIEADEERIDIKKKNKKGDGEINVKNVEKFATLTILTHEEQVAEVEKRKVCSNYTNSAFKCDLCYKGFVDTGTFTNHMRRHDAASGEFECPVCRVRRSTAHRLRGHITAVHARRYTCRTCRRVSTNANQALEHEKWHRGVKHQCQFCDRTFSKWSSRLSHERLRHRSQFVCAECGDAFVSRLGLAQHAGRAHPAMTHEAAINDGEMKEDLGTYCVECDVHFSTQEAYTRHTLTSDKHGHDATMSTGCRRCGVVFTTEEAWSEHASAHAVRCGRVRKRMYILPRCGRVVCQECGEEFKAASHCMAHYKKVHPEVKYPAEFVCETCGRKCRNRAVLLYHQRTHTGERPFPCNVCGAAFKHQSNLRRHSRVHTGEKLFECELCCKRFTQKVGKEMHIRTVHEKQPYPRRNRSGPANSAHEDK